MNNIERRDQQILYISDDAVFEEQKKCRSILQKLNFMNRADFSGISALVKELFDTSDGTFLNPPFYCDYGSLCSAKLFEVRAELTGLDRKVVDKTMTAMKKDGSIVSPVRCKWEPAS